MSAINDALEMLDELATMVLEILPSPKGTWISELDVDNLRDAASRSLQTLKAADGEAAAEFDALLRILI